jgi:hypothetical protein
MPRSQQNIQYLQQHGPAPKADLPTRITIKNKAAGLTKFDPKTGQFGQKATAIYYLHDRHEPKTIVDRWLAANSDAVEEYDQKTLTKVVSEYGDRFENAVSDRFDDDRVQVTDTHLLILYTALVADGPVTKQRVETSVPRSENYVYRLVRELTDGGYLQRPETGQYEITALGQEMLQSELPPQELASRLDESD